MRCWLVIFLAVLALARPSHRERRAGRWTTIRLWPEWRL
jgi:hypothetical protein